MRGLKAPPFLSVEVGVSSYKQTQPFRAAAARHRLAAQGHTETLGNLNIKKINKETSVAVYWNYKLDLHDGGFVQWRTMHQIHLVYL